MGYLLGRAELVSSVLGEGGCMKNIYKDFVVRDGVWFDVKDDYYWRSFVRSETYRTEVKVLRLLGHYNAIAYHQVRDIIRGMYD